MARQLAAVATGCSGGMTQGHRRTLAFFTSIFSSSYSGCRQYRENIAAAQAEVGPDPPHVEKVRMGFNHPEFINAQDRLVIKGT